MSEKKLDLSNVKVGTRVRLRNGKVANIIYVRCYEVGHDGHPDRGEFPEWYCDAEGGESICGTDKQYSIVEVLDDSPANVNHEAPVPAYELRDILAGCAMQGILANPSNDSMTNATVACQAYDLADEMLKARAK